MSSFQSDLTSLKMMKIPTERKKRVQNHQSKWKKVIQIDLNSLTKREILGLEIQRLKT